MYRVKVRRVKRKQSKKIFIKKKLSDNNSKEICLSNKAISHKI